MSDIFKDIIPAILVTKEPVLTEEKDYKPYIVNRTLSFHRDCIFYVNQMNMHGNLDAKMQFDYYINTIRPYKRPFQKWLKRDALENIELIKEYFDFSEEKAKDALRILSDADLEKIRKNSDKGGADERSRSISGSKVKRA